MPIAQIYWNELTRLPVSSLEKAESLEQLRWLENGFKITVVETLTETFGIDTPDDLNKAIEHLNLSSPRWVLRRRCWGSRIPCTAHSFCEASPYYASQTSGLNSPTFFHLQFIHCKLFNLLIDPFNILRGQRRSKNVCPCRWNIHSNLESAGVANCSFIFSMALTLTWGSCSSSFL